MICKPDGRPYRPDSTSTQFRKFVDDNGLPKTVHVHTLRHSAASFLAAAGVPASDIAAQLGHKDGGALKVYVHPMAEGLARAAAHLDQVVEGSRIRRGVWLLELLLELAGLIAEAPEPGEAFPLVSGGKDGIRTHGRVATSTVFETAPFVHSGTLP